MRLTWAEQMEAQYRQKGLETGRQLGFEEALQKGFEEGRKRGRPEGRKEGVRYILLRVLEKRFGEVSPAVQKRLEAIGSAKELNGLVDRILEIRSIEELGLGR